MKKKYNLGIRSIAWKKLIEHVIPVKVESTTYCMSGEQSTWPGHPLSAHILAYVHIYRLKYMFVETYIFTHI